MATQIVNLTLLKVNEELNDFLELCPEQSYQSISTNNDLFQEIIVYVLNRITNRFLAIPEESLSLIAPQFLRISTQEKLEIENLISQGIYQLMHQGTMPELQPIYLENDSNSYYLNRFG